MGAMLALGPQQYCAGRDRSPRKQLLQYCELNALIFFVE